MKTLLAGLLLATLTATPVERHPLAWAFRFASAIETDLVDQSSSQEKVIRDYLALGDLAGATQRVERIQNWRRGTAWADIATALTARGHTNEARQAIHRAEEIRRGFRGSWEADRIGAHVAQARAVADPNLPAEESAKTVVARANQLISVGQTTEAFKLLTALAESPLFDVHNALIEGQLQIARNPALTNAADRAVLLTGAQQVLARLPILRRMELVGQVATELHRAGDKAGAVRLLEAYEKELTSGQLTGAAYAPALARLGRAWLQVDQPDRGRGCLQQAGKLALTGDPMDQPGVCAEVAQVLAATGNDPAARQLCMAGLDIAAGFVNARPRAMAVADICRSLARQGVTLDDTQTARLQELLTGLKDPW